MVTKTEAEKNTWTRWALGIVSGIIITLIIHVGNEGSTLKQRMTAHEIKQAEIATKLDDFGESLKRIENKIDKENQKK